MAGVTPQGWESEDFENIIKRHADDAKAKWGESFPTTPDSRFGQYSNIIAAAEKALWDLGQSITENACDRDSAEGVYLDFLAKLIGLDRSLASGSTGQLLIEAMQNTLISAGTPFSDDNNNIVFTLEGLTLNRTGCYNTYFEIGVVADSTEYSVNVNGTAYPYTSGVGATKASITAGLIVVLGTGSDFTVSEVDEKILITNSVNNNTLSTVNSANITLLTLSSFVGAQASETGPLEFLANSITTIIPSDLGIVSVTNPVDFDLGRDEETDAELRLRMAQQEESTGTATKPAIEASLSEVTGVTNALIVPNNTVTTDLNGVPGKSFEAFVVGGDEDDIAEVIWRTQPATITSHGSITKIIIDDQGYEQVVKFSRKAEKFGWVRVTYSLNTEEDFPANGEDLMQQACIDFGNSMYSGEDLTPNKFYGPLYTSTPGMYVTNIEVAITNTELDTPIWGTATLPVTETENLEFNVNTVVIAT